MLTKSISLKHYKRRDIQQAIVEHALNKEIGMCYGQGYGKRPDILSYPRDVLELALKGVTSFHASEELWYNPLEISSTISKKELNSLRSGWDLVLDIDCPDWEISKLTTYLFIKALKKNNVEQVSCKFSGNKGFHIGVPLEAFPKEVAGENIEQLFPKGPKKIAQYLLHLIITKYVKVQGHKIIFDNQFAFSIDQLKQKFGEKLFFEHLCTNCHHIIKDIQPKKSTIEFICSNCDRRATSDSRFLKCEVCSRLMEKIEHQKSLCSCGSNEYTTAFDALSIIEVDTVLISSRHLYRMPYSLHEKSGLVSLPIDPNNILDFEKTQASPETLQVSSHIFLDRTNTNQTARELLLQALDFEVKIKEEREEPKSYQEVTITSPIDPQFFPPCIQKMSKGLEDGKKRALFCMTNFLGKIGWNKPAIEKYLKEWNKKNPEPLREAYIKGQLSSFTPGAKLPPNCNNDGYYSALACKCDEHICKRVKNPVNYTLVHWRRYLKQKEIEEQENKKKPSKKEEPTDQTPQDPESKNPSKLPEATSDVPENKET